MSLNPSSPDSKEISLATWGGLCTNMSPPTLPMGVSPDLSDCSFLLGAAFQRACLRKVYATPLGAATVTYGKSYVDPQGVIRNLVLDSLGNLWMENLTTAAMPVVIAVTTPGSYAKSVTAFGREYIAVSDGIHGQEVPLQYDGTNLDRVTQDGPGAPPTVASLALPPVAMAAAGSPIVLAVVECDPEGPDGSGYFTSIDLYTSSLTTDVAVGDPITVAGNTEINGGPFTVLAIYPGTPDSLIVLSAYLDPGTTFGTGGTATIPGATATRQENIVSITTDAPHQLQVGYQAQITEVPPAVVGGHITGIVIDNEDTPGIATVTTDTPHGLVPGNNVTLSGILPNLVATIASLDLQGEILTIETTAPHNLAPGAIVNLVGDSASNLNTTVTIQNTPSPTTLTAIVADADTSGTGGSVNITWPVPDTETTDYFAVVAAPTATTFQIAINYCDATFGGGSGQLVSFAWDGIFYVASVFSPATPGGTDYQSFTYQQYGPNATTAVAGNVTPFGQAAPGIHQLQVSYLTRQGAITAPSPPVRFVANGGQYVSVTNIPIGPPNVVGRILEFTGAQGAYFFYIPAPPQVNGQIVGTATQINDNTTTSVILDFGDPTLFSALGISIPGNNLANQVVLDSALGFGFFGSRLITYGQRNTVDNFLNLGFDGGFFPNAPNYPTGWVNDGSGVGQLAGGHYGDGWQIPVTPATPKGSLSQSAYEDYSGAPIAEANTLYRARVWLKPSVIAADLKFFVLLNSASTAFQTAAEFDGATMNTAGSWLEATFNLKTPAVIPQDFTLQIYAQSTASTLTLLVDEIRIIYADTPYSIGLIGSYVNNPEGFDGVTGPFGPEDDTHQVMGVAVIRSIFYMLTLDPAGQLHETSQGTTEPADWVVNQVAANCGLVSTFALTVNQASDNTESGGEDWFAWYSSTGARIFGGELPEKISQEIQRPAGQTFPGAPPDLGAFNAAAGLSAWALNDPESKIMWFGIPTAGAAPGIIYAVSYLGMDSAGAIAGGAPVHRSLSGKMSANDLSRKWSPWKLTINGAALIYRGAGNLEPVFFAGNGHAPGAGGFGNIYTLDASKYADDDYGVMAPYYTTYAFPDRDQEQGLQLGGHMKMISYTGTMIPSGVGNVLIEVLPNVLAGAYSPWPLNATYQMQSDAPFDAEWSGGNCQAQRFFFRYSFTPLAAATDVAFGLASLTVALKQAKHLPVRGVYP